MSNRLNNSTRTSLDSSSSSTSPVPTMKDVLSYEALYDSMLKCKSNVLWKTSTAHFYLNAPKYVLRLKRELESGKYRPAPTKTFMVMSAKRREVMGVTFKDRVYQRSLCDNAVYPLVTKGLIYDNCACQKGKGTLFARKRLVCFMQKFYRKHHLDGYILKCDIKGYYPNMRHDVALSCFRRRLPDDIYKAVEEVFRSQYDGDVGFFPGSQLVQIAGIVVLDDLDHYIKNVLKVKYYLRYMDDFILIHPNKEYLEYCKQKIQEQLNNISFELHPKKTAIVPFSEPLKFLGFYHRITSTGKIVQTVDPKNVKRMRKKIVRMVHKCNKHQIPKEYVDEAYRCWRVHASEGNSYHLIKRTDAWYKSLFHPPLN